MNGEEVTIENTFTTLAINAGSHYALGLASKGLKKLVGSKASQASGVGDVDEGVNKLGNFDSSFNNPVSVENKGHTGRIMARNLQEQMAMNEVMSNPLVNATELPIIMTDPRWMKESGWVKMQRIVELSDGRKINIHYVYNKILHQFDDFKFIGE